jgi:hypothetical protein
MQLIVPLKNVTHVDVTNLILALSVGICCFP